MNNVAFCLTLSFAAAVASDAAAAAAPGPPGVRELPFEIASNKPYVQVRINGSAPQWFILDTGCRGTSLIARQCAERLHLPLGDVTPTHLGAGQGVSVGFTTTPNVTLDVAGDTLVSPALGVIPMDHVSPYEGRRVDGLLGEDFMRRHVVEIDYARRRIRLFDPATYHYSGASTPIPITFDQGLVVAQAEMAPRASPPIACRVVVDTGVRTTVIWYHPFVVEHALVASQAKVITGTIGGGAGGETTGDIGRLDHVTIGSITLKQPTVVFSRDTTGVFAGRSVAGIVGGEVLRRCTVTFDYSHQELFLEPYPEGVAGFDYDMSGLFLVAPGPDFKRVTIQSVAAGTPAQEAGLLKGDEIMAVDGRRTDQLTLDQVRELFKKDGATYRLDVKRGQEHLQVRLTPHRLV